MRILSIIFNLVIFAVTFALATSFFRKNGSWDVKNGFSAFRYFTVLSNVIAGLASLFMAVCQIAGNVLIIVWHLKYLGTVMVTVTFLTVILYLGPRAGGYKDLLAKENLYMHLIIPILTIISFCFFEKGKAMSINLALCGVLPVILYGTFYLYKIMLAPEEKRWEDFYGFNREGKWYITFGAFLAASVCICILLRFLYLI